MSFDLSLTRGDDRTLTVTVDDVDGNPYPWAGAKLWFTAKHEASDADADAVFLKTSGGDGIDFPAAGIATVTIDRQDTASLPNAVTTLHCDVQLKTAAGKIHTVEAGTLRIQAEISLAVA